MSTITKEFTKEQLQQIIETDHVQCGEASSLARIALASLEAEPAIHRWRRVTSEPYGPYPWHYGDFIGFSKPVDGIEDEYFYTAPPAPVSVPDAMEMDDNFDSAFEHGKAVGWNAYRAAMLQGGNHTEQHLDMVDHNEKGDCRLPFEQWLSQQNKPIYVDCGCVTTEAFYHWLRIAYEAGNSPVTPDCSDNILRRWLAFGRAMQSSGSQLPRHLIAETESMLAAAPQKEVKK